MAAIAVLYHPELAGLRRLIETTDGQVDSIYVIDNTPVPDPAAQAYLGSNPSVIYISLGRNVGIAAAQNIGIRASMEARFTHVLLLDQDSALPAGMVDRLRAGEELLLREGRQVGAVGPQFWDEKTGKTYPAVQLGFLRIHKLYLDMHSTQPVEADYLIASGSLLRVSVLKEIGLMREDLFIDWVDVEWGLRARSSGYISYHIPNALMTHNVGDAVVSIFGRDVHVHSDIRNYYMLRNALYLFRLKSMGWRWRVTFAPRIPCYLLVYPMLSGSKSNNIKLIWRALRDGIGGRLGPLGQSLDGSRG